MPGTISGPISAYLFSGSTTGLVVSAANISGGLANAGFITTSSFSVLDTPGDLVAQTALVIESSKIQGDVYNNGEITSLAEIVGTQNGIVLENNSTIIGSIVNGTLGLIAGQRGTGILIASEIKGGITSFGQISAGGDGIDIESSALVTGAIVNGTSASIVAKDTGIRVSGCNSFPGNVVNYFSATVKVGNVGILIDAVSTFAGDIANFGTIAPSDTPQFNSGIVVKGVGSFAGGINNSGTIVHAEKYGILVDGPVSTFTGGVSNSGRILSANVGVYLQAAIKTFAGGIDNSGTIDAVITSVRVSGVESFLGAISNSGTMDAATSLRVSGVTSFLGAISNSGAILAANLGIGVSDVAVFGTVSAGGGITNSGTISVEGALGAGIRVGFSQSGTHSPVPTFTGNIANSGTITGFDGIEVADGTIDGSIVDSGLISGGIEVETHGVISATETAILVDGPTFTGTIYNLGTIATAGDIGVWVDDVTSFAGGINDVVANAHITAQNTGIRIQGVSTLSGGITTSGTISAGLFGIAVEADAIFIGGISNFGTISDTDAAGEGIIVDSISSFSGGLSNFGSIAAPRFGLVAFNVAAFTGNISNAGSITAGDAGVFVDDSTINGAIVDSGAILGSGAAVAIEVEGTSEINADNAAAIMVRGPTTQGLSQLTITGGLINDGKLSSAASGILIDDVLSFGGGIFNSGTISAASYGVRVGVVTRHGNTSAVTAFAGGITNLGNISGANNAGIAIQGGNFAITFAGVVSNGGEISAGDYGIFVTGIEFLGSTSASGGVRNTGALSATGTGIFVDNIFGTLDGAINNSGTISAGQDGISLRNVTSFTDDSAGSGINNAGTISATGDGIYVSNIVFFGSPGAKGGITNTGAIEARGTGIFVNQKGFSLAGNVSNNGTIAASDDGILVENVRSLTGSIVNSKLITAATGIALEAATIDGTIVDSGMMLADRGIAIDSASKIDAVDAAAVTVDGATTFFGGISNDGTIAAGFSGISVAAVASFAGGISNSGMIATTGIGRFVAIAGINLDEVASFAGSIGNNGTISAKESGILVGLVTTLSGSIINAGSIAAGNIAIDIIDSTIGGSIVDSGVISASEGISIDDGSEISTTDTALNIEGSSFAGGISNAGTISASGVHGFGILVHAAPGSAATFSGGITNAGTVLAGAPGIEVSLMSSFSGDIDNAGTISTGNGNFGIAAVNDGTFAGDISNGGAIIGTGVGIAVAFDTDFSGSVVNTGMISAEIGIEARNTPVVDVFNAGTIIGTTGTAVDFVNDGTDTYTFTLGAGYDITGNVVGDGSDVFQLGGTSSGTFDLSAIGSGQQYRGFTTFEVVGATWLLTGTGDQNWSINAGTLELGSGGTISGNVLFAGEAATLRLDTGTNQIAGGMIVGAGGGDTIDLSYLPYASGEQAVWTQSGGNGTLELVNGGSTLATMELSGNYSSSSGEYFVLSGDGRSGTDITLSADPMVANLRTETAPTATDLKAGGTVTFTLDMSETGLSVKGAPALALNDGGVATYQPSLSQPKDGVLVFKYTVAAGQNTPDLQVTGVTSGAWSVTDSAGRDADFSGAEQGLGLIVDTNTPKVTSLTAAPTSGGTEGLGDTVTIDLTFSDSPLAVSGMPTLKLSDGSVATYVSAGSNPASGILQFAYVVGSGQNTKDLEITAVSLTSGASIKDLAGNAASLALTSTEKNLHLTIDSVHPTVISAGAVPATGTVSSGGTVTITLKMSEAVAVSSGGPILALNDGGTAAYNSASSTSNSLVFTYSVGSETTADLTIVGVENGGTVIGSAGNSLSSAPSENLKLAVNTDDWKTGKSNLFSTASAWTESAPPASTQEAVISVGGTYTVSATANATVGALAIDDTAATLLIGGGATFSATNGTDADSDVGKITVLSGGTFDAGGAFDNKGMVAVSGTANIGGTISNAGTIEALSGGNVTVGGTVTNAKTGVIDGASTLTGLTLNGMIANSGLIEGKTALGLVISSTVTNAKTIEAVGTSAMVDIVSTTIANSSVGLIEASGSSAQVELDGASIIGGKLKAAGKGAAIEVVSTGTSNNVLSRVTIAAGTVVEVSNGANVVLAGTLDNAGTISANAVSETTELVISGAVTLTGAGKITLSNDSGNDIIAGATGALTNVNNTVAGAGTISAGLTLINSVGGTIDGSGAAALILDAATSNYGILEGATSQGLVISAAVTNFNAIKALGTSALVDIVSTTITDTSVGVIEASGSSAQVTLDGVSILGGKLETSGKYAAIVIASGTADAFSSVRDTAAMTEVENGATLTVSGGSLAASALIDLLSGGTAIVAGTVSNGGMLFASGAESLLDIVSTGVVKGGLVAINNGDVELESGGSATGVFFTSTGAGGLILEGTGSGTYSGLRISGFGGNDAQSIDFTTVSSSGAISVLYVSAPSHTSGTLEIMSGVRIAAEVTLVGKYVTSNFRVISGIGGSVAITDPAATIATGATVTLAATAVSMSSLVNIVDASNTALLGSYMASLFAEAEGQVGIRPIDAPQSQAIVVHPHTG